VAKRGKLYIAIQIKAPTSQSGVIYRQKKYFRKYEHSRPNRVHELYQRWKKFTNTYLP